MDPSTQLEISYDLRPAPHYVDLQTEQATALATRAELVQLQNLLANWNECATNLAGSLLALADPRMRVELAKLKQLAETSCIWSFHKPEVENYDPCEDSSVRQQTEEYYKNNRDVVFLNIKLAAVDMQNAFEQMVIADDEIQRLEKRVELIEAKRELDATQAYIDLQENWFETLQTRSTRISQAVKYESAQIRLAEATGALTELCGFSQFIGEGCHCQ